MNKKNENRKFLDFLGCKGIGIFVLAAVFLILFANVGAAIIVPHEEWSKTYAEFGNGQGRSVQQTFDGGYITLIQLNNYSTGVSKAFSRLVKSDRFGNEEWNAIFEVPNSSQFLSVNQTDDGGYILGGYTTFNSAGGWDVWLLKTDKFGNEEWEKTFGGTGSDYAWSVQQTSDGGYAIVGTTNSYGAGSNDVWFIKTDKFGNIEWEKTYGGIGSERGYSIQEILGVGYIISGHTTSYGAGAQDGWLIKTDLHGNELWNRTVGGNMTEWINSVRITSDGGFILIGYTSSSGAGSNDLLLVKMDADGNELWNRTYGGINYDIGYSVQETPDGGYLMFGLTASFGTGGMDAWLVRADSLGNELWNKTFGGAGNDYLWFGQITSDGGSVFTGYTTEAVTGNMVAWLVKVSNETIILSANLQLSKTAPITSENGTQIIYTLNVHNSADVAVSGVILVDPLPLNTVFVTASDDGTYDPATGNVTWNPGSVPTNSDVSRTVTVEIPTDVPVGTVIMNTASVSTTDVESDYSDNSASASTTVIAKPLANLQLFKTAPLGADNGTQIVYTLNIGNSGASSAAGVILTDTLPSNVVFVTASDDGNYDSATGNVIWDLGSITAYPDGNLVRTVTVEIPTDVLVGTVIVNTASVSTTDVESDYSDNSASASTTVTGPLAANLQLSKVGVGYIGAGYGTGYALYYQNLGQTAASNVTIVDTLPPELESIEAYNNGTYDPVNRTVTWNLGTVPANSERYQIWLMAKISYGTPAGTVVRNDAMISTTDPESNYTDNNAYTLTRVAEPTLANLILNKWGFENVSSGISTRYTLNYINLGDTTASNAKVVDTLPANEEFVSASNNGTYDAITRTVTWNLGSVYSMYNASGSTTPTLTLTVQIPTSVPIGTVIVNTASISTTSPESNYGDNSGSFTSTVTGQFQLQPANLQLVKTARANVSDRTQVIYTLNVSNSGRSSAPNVTLVDTLPVNEEFVSASNNGTYDAINRTVTWKLVRVLASGYGSRTLTVQIPTSVPVGTVIENTATVNTTGLESNYSDNNASAIFTIADVSLANLQVSKTGPVSMDRGNLMTYTMYFSNSGDTSATGVILVDTIPSDVQFVSASDGGSYDPTTGNVTWNLDTVLPYPNGYGFRTVTVEIPESVPVGTVIQNTAFISTTDTESRYEDNSATASTRVTGTALPANVSLEPTNGISGGVPSVHYTTPETFSLSSSCATNVNINIHLNDGGSDISGSMIESAPGIWTYTTTFYPRHGTATITYAITGCEVAAVSFNIYIDPAGYIYDIATDERISGASVWLQQPDGTGGWKNVSVGQSPAVMQPDVNPLTTNADGQYQWDVLAGIYRVHVEANGYYPADSIEVSIPPPVTDLHVGLTRIPVLDNTAPVITIESPDNISYILNQSVPANWQAIDSESGISSASATVPNGSLIETSSVGSKIFTVDAIDNAGNEANKIVNYNVVYNFSGILQPINTDGNSVFKLGSTVPVKFQLMDSKGNFVSIAVAKIYVAKVSDGIVGTDMEAISTSSATTGNLFRYDSTANQYIFNLATKTLTKGTWQIRIELNDGTSKSVNIGLK